MEGGSANDYSYGFGDPVNGRDLDGRCWIVSGHILPCGGDHPYIPKGGGGSPVRFEGGGGGWVDDYKQVWKWHAKGDVTTKLGKGKHTNIRSDSIGRGMIHHGSDKNFPRAAIRPVGWFPNEFFWFVPIPYDFLRDQLCRYNSCGHDDLTA